MSSHRPSGKPIQTGHNVLWSSRHATSIINPNGGIIGTDIIVGNSGTIEPSMIMISGVPSTRKRDGGRLILVRGGRAIIRRFPSLAVAVIR